MPPKESGLIRTDAVGARRRCLLSRLLGAGGPGGGIFLACGFGVGVTVGGCNDNGVVEYCGVCNCFELYDLNLPETLTRYGIIYGTVSWDSRWCRRDEVSFLNWKKKFRNLLPNGQ